MYEIRINQLELNGYIGFFDFEKENGQKFLVDALIKCNGFSNVFDDNLEETVDYGKVCATIKNYFDESKVDLLETATYELAELILLEYPLISSIKVTIAKPDAPIEDVKFDSVSVTRELTWHRVALALGSNIGDSNGYFDMAIETLKEENFIRFVKESSRIKTAPYGGVEQDDFLNSVVLIDTYLTPEELLKFTSAIEQKANRTREVHWGPRTLDVDIILYADKVISSEELCIPHVDMLNRDFVLRPLAEIAGNMIHPLENDYIKNIYERLFQGD